MPLARILFLVVAALTAYATLYPLEGWRATGVSLFAYLSAPWPRHVTRFDLVVNVLGYVPFGFLAVAALEPKLRARNTALMLLSYGDAEKNRALAEEHGLSAPILLQENGKPHPLFATTGTPVAYLLDEQGRVASQIAVGANEVPELARAAADGRRKLTTERSLDESRIERDGLKAGTRAPDFALEDVRGGEVSLADYRGRSVLLVFSDPDCGPCNALLPDLAKVQERAEIVMISRGDPAENRAKAEEHGLGFPVLLQKGWTLSKQYGIFATPVAFLVDAEGVLARDVARGRDQILALAQEQPARKEVPLTH
jgi:peroxiredoxin